MSIGVNVQRWGLGLDGPKIDARPARPCGSSMSDTSSQVGEILEVLEHVLQRQPRTLTDVRAARLDSVKAVARDRNITEKSVTDKLWRKLEVTIREFDQLVLAWMAAKDDGLQRAILAHAASRPLDLDRRATRQFFAAGKVERTDEEQIERDMDHRADDRVDEDNVGREFEQRFRNGDYSVPEKFSKQKVRIGQDKWRRLVLDNFGFACAICGLDIPQLLEAAHVLRWNDDKSRRLDPRNGIAMCVLHHRAYDRGFLSVKNGIVLANLDGTSNNDAVDKTLRAYDGAALARGRLWQPLERTL
jgi:hypothetical protein